MLLACITLKADGSEATICIRSIKKGIPEAVYSGMLSHWDSLKTDIKKYGPCIICFYEGELVHCIDKTINRELSADLTSNAKMMAEVCPDDRSKLLFVDRGDLSGTRRTLMDSGLEVLAEHLIQPSRLESDKALTEYYETVCRSEISLKTGTIDERKMLAYRVSRLRATALPILIAVFALSICASLISMHTSTEKEKLSLLMRSYSSAIDKTRHSAGDIEKVLSTREPPVPCSISSILYSINSISHEGLLLKNVSISGNTLVIDATTVGSRYISDFSRAIFESQGERFDNVEVSEVKQSAMKGNIDFKITAHIK